MKAQVSVEYLLTVGVSVIVAITIVTGIAGLGNALTKVSEVQKDIFGRVIP